jgi:CBS domain-containing protein
MTRIVADIMATELVTFSPDTIIHKAIQVLLSQRLSGAPVIDETRRLVGVLSKKDCLKIALSSSYYQDWGGTVQEYMSANVVTLDADTDLVSAAEFFLGSNYRRFPVMRDGQLVGQISRTDVLRALVEGA